MSSHSRPRFEAIVRLLPTVGVLADIGAGDLDLARLALACGRAARVVAVERSAGAFHRARERAASDGRIDLRQGDGFDPVRPGETQAAVLAGLGGRAVARIVVRARDDGRGALPPFILAAPNADALAAVAALHACGFALVGTALVAEGPRLRPLVLARRGALGTEGSGAPGGEVGGQPAQGTGAALWAAYVTERVTAWRRQLPGAAPARAAVLALAIEEAEATL